MSEKIEVQMVRYVDKYNYRSGIKILSNEHEFFSVFEGEPEDMTLGRDLSDCLGIVDGFKRFYELGKQGKDVVFLPSIEKDWSELD